MRSCGQFQQSFLTKNCFECGGLWHLRTDCPRLQSGTKTMVQSLFATPTTQPTAGRGQACKGHPRGRGQTHGNAFPGRPKVVASDAVITGIVSACHRDAYSYVSSQFVSYLDTPHDSLKYSYLCVYSYWRFYCCRSCLMVLCSYY